MSPEELSPVGSVVPATAVAVPDVIELTVLFDTVAFEVLFFIGQFAAASYKTKWREISRSVCKMTTGKEPKGVG